MNTPPNYRTMTPRTFPDLVDIEQELFELPHKARPFSLSLRDVYLFCKQERVIYNKEVQTTFVETEPSADYEQEVRQRILREKEAEAEKIAREKELEEESVKLDQEIEQEIRGDWHF